jgi:serine/threonine-protein phosphatase 6 regulatory ankyrin repeat subunit B
MKYISIFLVFVLFGCNDNYKVLESTNEGIDDTGMFNSNGYTPLMEAVKDVNVQLVRSLLDEKSDPNIQNEEGDSALSLSITFEHLDVLKVLLNSGGNPEIFDLKRKESLIFRTMTPGKLEYTKALVEAGANVNAQDAVKNTSLMLSATLSQYDLSYYLLINGADPTLENNWGNTVKRSLNKDDLPDGDKMVEWKERVINLVDEYKKAPPLN